MRDHRACRATTAPTLSQAATDNRDPQERQALPETRDRPELQETPDKMAPEEAGDRPDNQAETETQETRDRRDHRASQATGDLRDRRDLRDHQVSQATQDRRVRTASRVNRDLREKTPSTARAPGGPWSTRSRPPPEKRLQFSHMASASFCNNTFNYCLHIMPSLSSFSAPFYCLVAAAKNRRQ